MSELLNLGNWDNLITTNNNLKPEKMYIQCQSTDEKFFKLGSCTGYTKAYTSDTEARESFFNSLINESDFYADEEKECRLKILSVKRAGKGGSPYLEFTAIGYFYGMPDVPILGLIAFQGPGKFKIVKKPKITIIRKN